MFEGMFGKKKEAPAAEKKDNVITMPLAEKNILVKDPVTGMPIGNVETEEDAAAMLAKHNEEQREAA